ncbi:Ankyrin repeat and BTB/POZ domain-containing protein 1 [Elasticomyces elasticus]|nr:Ankyrin repeat and BTB/POZ domain-containing protein 1 [Elasticomyces elasticus]KAK3662075.1 Ankyrin repeat and BTB/POZ domain-containing protein 1 [Elasticomyces elasticus]KAK4927562.1 Ankyrin repeat and BTB/POZ domain-containing protein 1 [Elasticomyces elasticus]KAK5753225.1 Ankyrin repeat and BTB/POZ domain-containing protein 1 [Elasticomyces elasticus]
MSTSDGKPKNQAGEQAPEPFTQAPQRYNAVIRLLAGKDRESISVHRDVLCRGSDFFVKACSKAWLQDEEDKYITDGIVTVEAVDLTTMDLYIHGKYYDKIDISRIHDVRKRPTTSGPRKAHDGTACNLSEIGELVRLYVAGDYFLESYHLSNQIISELAIRVERWSNGSPFIEGSLIDYVWDNTAPDATLRSLILDSCSATATMESLLDGSGYPQEFIHDLMLRGIELRDLEPSIKVPRIETHCRYHEHKGDQAAEEKARCKEWARDAKWSVAGLPVKKLELRAQRPVFPEPGWSLVS